MNFSLVWEKIYKIAFWLIDSTRLDSGQPKLDFGSFHEKFHVLD